MPKEGALTDQVVAELAWTAMRRHKVTPMPRNFELWFAYVRGTPPDLKQDIDAMVAERQAFTPAALDALHQNHLAPQTAPADPAAQAQAVREIAATLVAQVASNQQGVAAYGNTLAHWTARLQRGPTIGELQQAIGDLVAETQQAHARNAMLEQQIASSIVRVDEITEQPMGSITVSIGVAVFRDGDTGTDLVERADKALYRAKHSGRNLVCTEAMVLPGGELVAG